MNGLRNWCTLKGPLDRSPAFGSNPNQAPKSSKWPSAPGSLGDPRAARIDPKTMAVSRAGQAERSVQSVHGALPGTCLGKMSLYVTPGGLRWTCKSQINNHWIIAVFFFLAWRGFGDRFFFQNNFRTSQPMHPVKRKSVITGMRWSLQIFAPLFLSRTELQVFPCGNLHQDSAMSQTKPCRWNRWSGGRWASRP